MAIFSNRKPGWQQRDPEVRLAALNDSEEIAAVDLAAIVRDDPEERVRSAAALRLDDPGMISELLAHVSDQGLSTLLQQRLDLLYGAILRQGQVENWPGMVEAVKDEEVLVGICHGQGSVALRLAAAGRVNSEKNLAAIAAGPCGREIGEKVLARINTPEILSGLVNSANSRNVRRFAAEKMAEIVPENSDREEAGRSIIARAEKLLKPTDWDKAREEMQGLLAAAESLVRGQRLEFERIRREFSEKFAVIDKNRREQTEKAAANRRCLAAYEEICQGLEALLQAPDRAAGGDDYIRFTDRWMSMRENPATPLAPTAALERRFRQARKKWREGVKLAREEKKIVSIWREELSAIEKISSPSRGLARLGILREKVAASPVRYGDISVFKADMAALSTRLTVAAEEADRDIEVCSLEADKHRLALCVEIERLARETPGRKGANRIREIRDQWHALGRGGEDQASELEQRYHQALEKFHACHQEFIHEQEWRLWANFTVKERLAREVEALDREEDPATVYDCIRDLQRQWKEVGGVPRRESERLWQRFHLACERNFERCRPFLAEKKEERKKLREQHKGFLDRALELAESNDFAAVSAELKKMQAQWKEDGIGVDRQDFRIYKDFRRACNLFFARRHDDFKSREKDREKNLEEKIILCEEAEKMAAEPDWDLSRRFTDLQNRWKKIGPVPKRHDPAVWERFRAARNRYFAWLDGKRSENQTAREKLLARALSLCGGDDHKAAVSAVRELQKQWQEIGPVPRDRSESLRREFQAACEQVFSGLSRQREENERRKSELCCRAEELAVGDGDEKEISAALKVLQDEWEKIGPAAPAVEKELFHRLKNTCDIFFSGRRDRIEQILARRADDLRRKETLCLRLENLAGTTSEKSLAETDASALAAALQQAMQGNAIGATSSDKGRLKNQEIKKIQQQWQELGPVGREHDQRLNRRYRKALDVFYKGADPKG